MLFGRSKEKVTRQKFKESKYPVQNPGMGWYRPYLFRLEEEVEEGYLSTVIAEEERLCLVEVDLSFYNSRAISYEGIFHLEQILDFFHRNKKDIMLRFAYDFEGKAFEKEPMMLKLIMSHMKQISEVVKPYAQEILLYQGLFVGSWGEMHSSRYVTDLSIIKLYDAFRAYFGERACLALRTIRYISLVESARGKDDYLTLFDDAIYGSETDMATFSEGRKEEELDMYIAGGHCPVGGEVLSGDDSILEEMDRYHLSYLNSLYDQNALLEWESKGLLDEVKRRLGYRFLITDLNVTKCSNHTYLKLCILNLGSGVCPYDLTLEINMGGRRYKTSFDGRTILPTKMEELVIDLGKDTSGLKDSSLALYRSFDKTPIHFSNSGLRKDDKISFSKLWEM